MSDVVAPQTLRVFQVLSPVTDVLGPGRRAVVWVQGCTLRCRGCIVPESWTTNAGTVESPGDLARRLLADPTIEGLTVSGGEPTEQPGAVADLLEEARAMGRSTWVYTGRTVEELVALESPSVGRLLAATDVLVDGRYEESAAAALPLRGSSNQRIRRLTETIALETIDALRGGVSISIDSAGRVTVVGVPPPGFLPTLRAALERRGLSVVASEPGW